MSHRDGYTGSSGRSHSVEPIWWPFPHTRTVCVTCSMLIINLYAGNKLWKSFQYFIEKTTFNMKMKFYQQLWHGMAALLQPISTGLSTLRSQIIILFCFFFFFLANETNLTSSWMHFINNWSIAYEVNAWNWNYHQRGEHTRIASRSWNETNNQQWWWLA